MRALFTKNSKVICFVVGLFFICTFVFTKTNAIQLIFISCAESVVGKELDTEIWIERFSGIWMWEFLFSIFTLGILVILMGILLAEILNIIKYANLIEKFGDLNNNKIFMDSMFYGSIMMCVCHLYAYVNGFYFGDAAYIYNTNVDFFVSERWMAFIWGKLCGKVLAPWLSGVYSIIFMDFSIYFIAKCLKLKSSLAILMLAAVCSCNIAIIATTTYSGGTYYGELALLFASYAVYIWVNNKKSIINSVKVVLFICLSAATYGAYIGIIVCLFMTIIFMDFIKNRNLLETIRQSIYSVFIFFTGLGLYYCVLKSLLFLTNTTLQVYRNEDKLNESKNLLSLHKNIPSAYVILFKYYLGKYEINNINIVPKIISNTMGIVILFGIVGLFYLFFKNNREKKFAFCEKTGLCLYFLIFPLAINLIYIASFGTNPTAMMTFTYIFPLIASVKIYEIINEKYKEKVVRLVSNLYVLVMCGYILLNIIMANAVYTNMNTEYERSRQVAEQIIYRIEEKEYFSKNAKLIIIGSPNYDSYYGYSDSEKISILNGSFGNISSKYATPFTFHENLGNFITGNIANIECETYASLDDYINFCNIDFLTKNSILKMDYFPSESSIREIDGNIIVRFKEKQNY